MAFNLHLPLQNGVIWTTKQVALVFGSLGITRTESVVYHIHPFVPIRPKKMPILRKLCGSNFYREFPLLAPNIAVGKFLHHPTSVSHAAISVIFLGSASGPIELFDALRHFQAPSPDAAFAINTSEEFLADSAQNDCTYLPETRP